MKKEKVYIILSHKHSLKPRSRTEWEVTETVEFVNSVKRRHYQTASAIGDYLEEKMIMGSRVGMGEYEAFERYVNKKYGKQMSELAAAYPKEKTEQTVDPVVTDEFGNVRAPTVFDRA